MKINLAENLLRFAPKNLDANTIEKIQQIAEQAVAPKKTVTIPFKQQASYAPGDSKPTAFINEMFNGILAAINKDPLGKQMLASKSIVVYRAFVFGSASNVWGGKPTGYDTELNGQKTNAPQTETELYAKNKALAQTRAKACWDALTILLQKQGITVVDANPTITGNVANSGGKLDAAAQRVDVKLYFRYKKIEEISGSVVDVAKYVTAGHNALDGKSPTGQIIDPKTIQLSTGNIDPAKLPALQKTPRMISWEIKWDPNVLDEARVIPFYRWIFIYNKDGFITNIQGRQFKDAKLPATNLAGYFTNKDIPLNDPEMIQLMSTPKFNIWDTRVKPFLATTSAQPVNLTAPKR